MGISKHVVFQNEKLEMNIYIYVCNLNLAGFRFSEFRFIFALISSGAFSVRRLSSATIPAVKVHSCSSDGCFPSRIFAPARHLLRHLLDEAVDSLRSWLLLLGYNWRRPRGG